MKTKTAKALRAIILAGVEQDSFIDFVPRECRFGTKGELEAMKPAEVAPAPVPTKPAKKPKAKPRSRRGMIHG